jgi:SnoaL-like domain
MTRLGAWVPTTIEERLDRMESEAMIRQLPSRYAYALDSRDLAQLVQLFVPDVQVGREGRGRDALFRFFDQLMRFAGVSVHFVGNHVIDFDDADHAHGVVYCFDELERADIDEWQKGRIQYWDTYERGDGEWCFVRRRLHRWYVVDALTRPSHGAGIDAEPLVSDRLPDVFDTWYEFLARTPEPR